MVILTKIVQIAAAHNPQMNENSAHRLWPVFLALVEFEHGDRMDEQKEREAIEIMAQQCAELDVEIHGALVSNLSERLTLGLTSGTANADSFAKASVLAKVQIGLGKAAAKVVN